jgi:hypothetical protein
MMALPLKAMAPKNASKRPVTTFFLAACDG